MRTYTEKDMLEIKELGYRAGIMTAVSASLGIALCVLIVVLLFVIL